VPLDAKRKEKISINCGVAKEDIISAPDSGNIYEIPVNFEKDKMGDRILDKFELRAKKSDLDDYKKFAQRVKNIKKEVRIGIVGKYFGTGDFILADSYISVIEAIKHASYIVARKPVIEWVDAENFGDLDRFDGVIIPGGFGSRGAQGKINAIKYVRENRIPYLGLCYGMQLAVVEFARSIAGLKRANSTEIDIKTPHPVIDILPEQREKIKNADYGGTMRLGAYRAILTEGTIVQGAYGSVEISERHRHRYEVNPKYIARLEAKGMVFSGKSPDKRLMETMELSRETHPFFVGTQFHPELKSRPLTAHPIFLEFIKAAS